MDRTVWITGASSGIGEALAYAYAGRGDSLILSARNEEKLAAVRDRCQGAGSIWVEPMDLAGHDRIPIIAGQVLDKVGRVDILIHNAGVTQRSRVAETLFEVDKRIMDVNFLGAVALTKVVLPAMLDQGGGKIGLISSVAGKFATPMRSAYAASKHALHGYFDALRAEVYDRGIRVTLICPGFVRTDVSRNALTGSGDKHGVMDPRTARGIEPEKVARRVVRAIDRNKREVYIGGFEISLVYLKRFFPGLLARLVRGMNAT